MPQTSLYMDDATITLVREESKRRGVSLSSYIASAVNNCVNHISQEWPVGYWDAVCGCLGTEVFSNVQTDDLHDEENTCALDPSLDDDCSWFA